MLCSVCSPLHTVQYPTHVPGRPSHIPPPHRPASSVTLDPFKLTVLALTLGVYLCESVQEALWQERRGEGKTQRVLLADLIVLKGVRDSPCYVSRLMCRR